MVYCISVYGLVPNIPNHTCSKSRLGTGVRTKSQYTESILVAGIPTLYQCDTDIRFSIKISNLTDSCFIC